MGNQALPRIKLYHYWRSSSSWRVRWAFAIKGIACEYVPVNLLNGESESPEHRARNPLGYVPVLEFLPEHGTPEKSRYLCESTAIIEWTEESVQEPSILTGDLFLRAKTRMLAQVINADTQPLQNPNTLEYYSDDPEMKKTWARHWIQSGLGAYEQLVKETAGRFSVGDQLSLADLCLIPQCYNAERFQVGLESYPTIQRIYQEASQTESFKASHPSRFEPRAS